MHQALYFLEPKVTAKIRIVKILVNRECTPAPYQQNKLNGFPSYFLFWSLAFLYSCFVAILLQKFVLPLLPSLHAYQGLMNNDAIVFHEIALKQAILIHDVGWSAWHLFPSGMPANVGLLSVVYAVLGSDPVWFVPFNAAAHATGAMMIYHIGPVLLPGKRGQLGGLIGGVAFLVFPSALQWYGQNHKDAFECAGMLMFVYVWLKMMSGQDFTRKIIFKYLCIAFSGALLFAFIICLLLLYLF